MFDNYLYVKDLAWKVLTYKIPDLMLCYVMHYIQQKTFWKCDFSFKLNAFMQFSHTKIHFQHQVRTHSAHTNTHCVTRPSLINTHRNKHTLAAGFRGCYSSHAEVTGFDGGLVFTVSTVSASAQTSHANKIHHEQQHSHGPWMACQYWMQTILRHLRNKVL